MQDSAYLLQVPAIAPDQVAMKQMPAILLAYDRFQDPRPHRLDWVVDIEDHIDTVLACLPAIKLKFLNGCQRLWV